MTNALRGERLFRNRRRFTDADVGARHASIPSVLDDVRARIIGRCMQTSFLHTAPARGEFDGWIVLVAGVGDSFHARSVRGKAMVGLTDRVPPTPAGAICSGHRRGGDE